MNGRLSYDMLGTDEVTKWRGGDAVKPTASGYTATDPTHFSFNVSEAGCTVDHTKMSVTGTLDTPVITDASVVGTVCTVTVDRPILYVEPAMFAGSDGWLIDAAGNHALAVSDEAIDTTTNLTFDPTLGGTLTVAAYYPQSGINESGGVLTTWDDASGNAKHINTVPAGNAPTVTGGVAIFDGVDQNMRTTGTMDMRTIFAVLVVESGYAGLGAAFSASNSGDTSLRLDDPGTNRFRGPNVPNTNGGDFVDSGELYINGTATDSFTLDTFFVLSAVSSSTRTGKTFGVGNDDTFSASGVRNYKGKQACWIVYGVTLTTAQRQYIESALTELYL